MKDNIYEGVSLRIVGDCLHALSIETEQVTTTPLVSTDDTVGLSVPEVRQSLVLVLEGKKTCRRRLIFSGEGISPAMTDEVFSAPANYVLTAVEAFARSREQLVLRLTFTLQHCLSDASRFPQQSFIWEAGYIVRADG